MFVGRRKQLKYLLAGESRAYGFTIAFWGSGALLINNFGAPNFIEAFSYGAGAVTGFGVLALLAFKQISEDLKSPKYTALVLSSVHYIASLIPFIITQIIIENISNPSTAFFLSGISVSATYNALSVLEEDIAEIIGKKLS